MKRSTLLDIVADEPLFTSGLLLGEGATAGDVHKQLSRWTADGTVVQLRRGLYALGARYRARKPHPHLVSNALVPGSYVSLESVLSGAGIIPDAVFVTTAVTTGRAGLRQTPVGAFAYRHIMPALFWGYESIDVGGGQSAFVATVEKALLDLAYLRAGSANDAFVRELRLQNLDALDMERLDRYARRFDVAKVARFARLVMGQATRDREEFEAL